MKSRQSEISLTPLIINKFRSRTTQVAFPHIAKPIFISDLEDRIVDPALIRQGDASLCGPASVMYCLAKLSPLTYANYAIDLFEKGQALLGDLNVKPSTDCKNHTPPLLGSTG